MIFAMVVFYFSLLGVVVLFGIKYWEQKRQFGFVSALRRKADERAIEIKALVSRGREEFAKLPVRLNHIARASVHFVALETARLARILEAQAHRLADFVSHKHHFEKSETKSEFLKKVGEHPMRNQNGSSEKRYSKEDISSGNDVTRRL